MFIFVILGLLVCSEAQGISAGTVFVLKGENVLLNVTAADVLQDVFSFSWTFNEKRKKVLTVNPGNNPIVFPDYSGRIEFAVNNFSVELKNLQEADSGVYTAVVTTLSGDVTEAAKYKIKVQGRFVNLSNTDSFSGLVSKTLHLLLPSSDRASLPLLTVSSVSDNSSSCSFTVTCSSQDSHINSTFRCDNQTYSQEGGERSEGIPDTFLQVHQSSASIICNHSNHVSWTNNTKTIKDVCHQLVDPEGLSVCLVKTCVFSVGLIIMVSAVITVHLMEKLNNNK
ncbi:SLAM family member 9-like isoform X3 [Gymnodraco acuticeps]|uniref:SLAM family member 9-like isoform X3 n=1 Tax=Gymnodraco acuticeps TaxID=8218 RepID=A0A6P8TIG2_GYMAC|nr:SLAM family member 9-like isoform X3 [Gymnodraco acuticeps]